MSEDLARQLRAAGRSDLADQLERPTEDPPAPDPDEAFARQIRDMDKQQWTHVPAFGEWTEEEADLVAQGIDRVRRS